MSAGQMGHVVSPATRAKLSAIHMGRIGWRHTSESRSKISQALTGIKRRPESIEKHRLAILGSHHSAEARRKMSEQRTGKPKPHQRKLSTEQVRVIRESRGKITQRRLAEMFGITAGAVCMIQKRQTYQDLE